MPEEKSFQEGLEDVVAGELAICDVNGVEGKLIYGGYDIHDLAEHATFEEVVHLLWHGKLPTQGGLDRLKAQLAENRAIPSAAMEVLHALPQDAEPMPALRTAVSLLGLYDPDRGNDTIEANERKALRLVAQMGTVIAALHRLSHGHEPVAPKPELSTAASFLYELTGSVPSDVAAHALDVALVLHADHELNASTFSARVTIATLTDMHSAITSAVGTLAGPLHGGANINVMHLLEKIGQPENTEKVVGELLASGQRVPGIGHRVYKTLDPRAVSLRRMSQELATSTGDTRWYEISERVQKAADDALLAKGKTTLKANVDFFSASVYHMLGIPTDLFTSVFAISRSAGWTAHVLEQLRHNRLIRPRAIYTGPRDLKVAPIAERK